MTVEVASVQEVKPIAEGIYSMVLNSPEVSRLILPGQFVMLEPKAETSVLPRPFTVYSKPHGSSLEIVFQVVGKNTEWYSQLQEGDSIQVRGPCGQQAFINPQAECFILVGGGCGWAPLHYMAQYIAALQLRVKVVAAAGFRTEDHVFGLDDLEVDPSDVATYIAIEDESDLIDEFVDLQGNSVDLFRSIIEEDGLPEACKIHVFTCGPKPMMKQIALLCQERGISCQVSLEEMMACGHGACKSCAVEMTDGIIQYVCKDGSLFPAVEVKW